MCLDYIISRQSVPHCTPKKQNYEAIAPDLPTNILAAKSLAQLTSPDVTSRDKTNPDKDVSPNKVHSREQRNAPQQWQCSIIAAREESRDANSHPQPLGKGGRLKRTSIHLQLSFARQKLHVAVHLCLRWPPCFFSPGGT